MDAMQKKRMRKVAVAHFFLTLFVVWKLIHYSAWSGPYEREIWFMAWGSFWLKIFYLFQPQFLLLSVIKFHVSGEILVPFFVLITVFWSLCFGWLFVKFDNWLNHYPVLGKKVFSNRKS